MSAIVLRSRARRPDRDMSIPIPWAIPHPIRKPGGNQCRGDFEHAGENVSNGRKPMSGEGPPYLCSALADNCVRSLSPQAIWKEKRDALAKDRQLPASAMVTLGGAMPAAAQEFPEAPVKIIIRSRLGVPRRSRPPDRTKAAGGPGASRCLSTTSPAPARRSALTLLAELSAPDGYTFGMVNSSLAVNPYLRKTMPYQVKDLAMITQLVILQQAIVAAGPTLRSTTWPNSTPSRRRTRASWAYRNAWPPAVRRTWGRSCSSDRRALTCCLCLSRAALLRTPS